MSPKYVAGIIDDDEKSIKLLSYYLSEYFPEITITATANNWNDGLSIINKIALDLVFIDIHLNENLGFELLDVAPSKTAQIIFISSHEKYALKVFKYNPVDYLLKPFNIKDLCASVNRALEKSKLSKETAIATPDVNNKIIAIPTGAIVEMIHLDAIKYCESFGNFTKFYLNNATTIVANKNIGHYELILPTHFFRIHKKYIVNITHIKAIHKSDGFYCEMNDKTTLSVSRRKQEEFQKLIHLK